MASRLARLPKSKQPNNMCDFERYNIKVVEGNEFTLLLPLKSRTFVARRPVDEDIVIEDLENLRVLVNNTEYSSVRKESDGVAIDFPATLKQGNYDVVLTATYHGVDIRAAYNDAVIIVAWNQQSDAQQYVQGSPFVLQAAYVLGVMTDSELEALKAQLRIEIAAAQQAKEEAEQAKEEYIAKAEALDDVAQQTTLVQGVSDIREDISHIGIDTSNLAKQGSNAGATLTNTQAAAVQAASDAAGAKTAAQDAKTLIGQPASGQPTDLFAAIAAGGGGGDAQESTSQSILAKVQQIIDAHIINNIDYSGYVFVNGYTPTGFGDIFARCDMLYSITDENITIIDARYYTWVCRNLHSVNMQNLKVIGLTAACPAFSGCTSLIDINLPNLEQANGGVFQGVAAQELSFPKLKTVMVSGGLHSNCFSGCTSLRKLSMPDLESISVGNTFNSDVNLIDIICGAKFTTNMGFGTWSPTNALDSSSSSLVEPGETFANNREKLLYNIREHFAANLPDRTGLSSLTITFSAVVKAAINTDAPTAAAFTNKNWTIA